MEFIFMTGIALVISFILIIIIGERIGINTWEKKEIVLNDYGYYLQNEFIIAAESYPGYRRSFYVYEELENIDFSLNNTKNVLIFNYSKGDLVWLIPETSGHIKKGNNLIQNINGTICINC
jgi:hypothetical protein